MNKIIEKLKSIKRLLGLSKFDWLLIVVGLTVFSVITFWTITKSSIWFDEAFGAYMINFNFAEITRYTAADVHPALYYWLLKLWSMFFGNTELALRSMSLFFGGISIVIGYLLSHRLFNKNVARVSLIFMVLSPMLVRYSQEMRMYTLLTAIAFAATYVLTFAVNTKRRLPWVIYGILVGLGMWTHYFAALIWIAHWLWRADIIRRLTTKGKFLKAFFSKEWVLAHIVAVGMFVIWLPFLLFQMLSIQISGFWIPAITPDTIINFLTNVIFYQDVGNVTSWLVLGFTFAVILMSWLAFRVYMSQTEAVRQAYRLIIAIAFVPVVLLFLASMPPLRSSFVERYLVPSTLGIAIFIGTTLALGIKLIRPKLRIIAVVMMAGLMLVGVTNVWHFGNYSKTSNASNNTRQIVDAIIEKSCDYQPIIADSPWLFYEASFYATNKHPVFFVDAQTTYQYGSLDMLKYNAEHKIMDIDKFTIENPIVWYVGLPRGAEFKAPYSNWEYIQEVSVNDSINGKPAYVAIQYKINASEVVK
jgi:uncharacterized membrane protein